MEKPLDILKKSIEILKTYPLCDYCLGRQFASIGSGLTNLERGRAIKTMLFMDACAQLREETGDAEILKILAASGFRAAAKSLENLGLEAPEAKSCYICNGVLNRRRFNEIAERISEELKEYEFKNFVVGARIPPDVREREDLIRSEFEIDTGEDIKGDVTREVGRILLRRFDAVVEYHNPEIVVLVDIFSNDYLIQVNPLFIKGFYKKLVRDLPQTPWYCRYCWGRGCEYCNYTGREYPESISELIGNPALEFFEALDYKFHGAGREDVDATVVGTGRPFVLELKHPRRRYLDLRELERLINERAEGKVEVSGLEYSSRRELRLLKSLSPMASKTYEAIVEFDGDVDEESLREVEERLRLLPREDTWTIMVIQVDQLGKFKRIAGGEEGRKSALCMVADVTCKVLEEFHRDRDYFVGSHDNTIFIVTDLSDVGEIASQIRKRFRANRATLYGLGHKTKDGELIDRVVKIDVRIGTLTRAEVDQDCNVPDIKQAIAGLLPRLE